MKQFIAFAFFAMLFCHADPVQAQTVIDNWQLKGNIATDPNTNFVGTVDNLPLSFRTNNVVQARIEPSGLFFVPKQATSILSISSNQVPSSTSIIVANTPITGAINLVPFQEKGRCFHIVNYSGANLTVSNPIQISTTGTTSTIGTGQRWCIVWDGLKFIRFL